MLTCPIVIAIWSAKLNKTCSLSLISSQQCRWQSLEEMIKIQCGQCHNKMPEEYKWEKFYRAYILKTNKQTFSRPYYSFQLSFFFPSADFILAVLENYSHVLTPRLTSYSLFKPRLSDFCSHSSTEVTFSKPPMTSVAISEAHFSVCVLADSSSACDKARMPLDRALQGFLSLASVARHVVPLLPFYMLPILLVIPSLLLPLKDGVPQNSHQLSSSRSCIQLPSTSYF